MITGFALTMWTNAWRALDALGIGDLLSKSTVQIQGYQLASANSNQPTSQRSSEANVKFKFENQCVRRKILLETLAGELPEGTIRFSAKVVLIEESGKFKLVHLADGSVIKTKVSSRCRVHGNAPVVLDMMDIGVAYPTIKNLDGDVIDPIFSDIQTQ